MDGGRQGAAGWTDEEEWEQIDRMLPAGRSRLSRGPGTQAGVLPHLRHLRGLRIFSWPISGHVGWACKTACCRQRAEHCGSE